MKVLGVDPGTRILGWALFDGRRKIVGRIEAKPLSAPMEQRLFQIFNELSAVFKRHLPSCVTMEDSYVKDRDKTVSKKLGRAQGLVMVLAVAFNCEFVEVTSSEAKKALTGKGNATKAQVQNAAKMFGGFDGVLEEDEADALAAAVAGYYKAEKKEP